MQTKETYKEIFGGKEISCGSNGTQLYFEKDDFDRFAEKIKLFDIFHVHCVKEHAWGAACNKVLRSGQTYNRCRRKYTSRMQTFFDSKMSSEEIAERMDVPIRFVNSCPE